MVDECSDFTLAKSVDHLSADGRFGRSAHGSRCDALQVEQSRQGLGVLHRGSEDQGGPVRLDMGLVRLNDACGARTLRYRRAGDREVVRGTPSPTGLASLTL